MMDPFTDDDDHHDFSFHDEEASHISRSSHLDLTNASNSKPSRQEEEQMLSSETRLVNRSKLLVYLALVIAAAAVSSVAFVVLKKDEEATMVVEFSAYSREILKQAQANALIMFEELMELSKSVTSHALDSEMTWPNVTLPHFDIRARHNKNFTLEFSGFAPFVVPADRPGWESYSVHNQDWLAQDYHYRGWNQTPDSIAPQIHKYNESAPQLRDDEDEMFDYEIPLWQLSPPRTDVSIVNLDLASVPVFAHLLWDIKMKKIEQYGRIMDLQFLLGEDLVNPHHPRGTIYQPVFEDFTPEAEVVGFMFGTLTWDYMFQNVIFGGSAPLLVEIEGTCNAKFTYKINGREIVFLGYGEGWRDPKFDKYKQSADLLAPKGSRPGYPPVQHTHRSTDAPHGTAHCTYMMNTYPTAEFQSQYASWEPFYMTLVIASVFAFTALVFLFYDCLVDHRQRKLLRTANRTNAIVSSLFPKAVQHRMMQEVKEKEKMAASKGRRSSLGTAGRSMSGFLNNPEGGSQMGSGHFGGGPGGGGSNHAGVPIADLFPCATIMFADICGFTAWSSAREPSQVFILLETLYGAFDVIARKRRVFKVETIGDCYVAVCGLPEERANHATIMARFARDCLEAMGVQLRSLERTLGPDTCDLGMRVGLHSGPVTAGVLRGERARFQLFGDTVNTTARIETTGQRNRIHISQETADLLIAHGKQGWIEKRQDEVEAKGKGKLSTYWLTPQQCGSLSADSDLNYLDLDDLEEELSTKDKRLVDWHVSMLSKILQQMQACRSITKGKKAKMSDIKALEEKFGSEAALKEVQEIIKFPIFTAETCRDYSAEGELVVLDEKVLAELRQFVKEIAKTYHDNFFHNFEHASHVTMSVSKLLSRIVQPPENDSGADHGYGITSDPLTQFAVLLSAIIHDADHPGIPNSQMIKEGNALASVYDRKSIAEQNSFQLSWEKLMTPSYGNLRAAIYSNEDELRRFRSLLVNSVMATDIMDKDLGDARKARWSKAFSEQSPVGESPAATINRKATIVIEHLIQASDIAHTQQHWHIYTKWNERLFMEMYKAYKEGRAEKDPSESWYNGELGFFDFYIIPLAKKLKDCGVFGVSSDEYLNYAQKNRAEWESKGKEQVQKYLATFQEEYKMAETTKCSRSFSSLPSIVSLISHNNKSSKRDATETATNEVDVDEMAKQWTHGGGSTLQPSIPPDVECPPARPVTHPKKKKERILPPRRPSKDYRQFLAGKPGAPATRHSYRAVSVTIPASNPDEVEYFF